jgi:hypothetical protein
MRKALQFVTLAALSVMLLSGCPNKGVELPKDSGVAFDKARDADTLKTGGANPNIDGGKKQLPPPR